MRAGESPALPFQDFLFELRKEALADLRRKIEDAIIGDDLHDILRSVDHRLAVAARFKVRFHSRTQIGIYGVVDVVGNLFPNLDATDFENRHANGVDR